MQSLCSENYVAPSITIVKQNVPHIPGKFKATRYDSREKARSRFASSMCHMTEYRRAIALAKWDIENQS
jgi:hypothetical protein